MDFFTNPIAQRWRWAKSDEIYAFWLRHKERERERERNINTYTSKCALKMLNPNSNWWFCIHSKGEGDNLRTRFGGKAKPSPHDRLIIGLPTLWFLPLFTTSKHQDKSTKAERKRPVWPAKTHGDHWWSDCTWSQDVTSFPKWVNHPSHWRSHLMSCDFKFPQLIELQRFARAVPQFSWDSLPWRYGWN